MQKQYEAVFIMTPVLSDQQMKETVDKFKAILTNGGAEIVHEENWGLKKLAYPVEHKSTGFYQLLQFKAEPSLIEKFDVELKRDERVIRWLTTALDKHAVEYAAKRAQKRSQAPAQEAEKTVEEPKSEQPVDNKEE
ncbi:MAG: 30S ribosomal protein S6 [Bacteroidales bacterium]|nr:30S ribosomal protein S6 [Bacteroidales bacterium]